MDMCFVIIYVCLSDIIYIIYDMFEKKLMNFKKNNFRVFKLFFFILVIIVFIF